MPIALFDLDHTLLDGDTNELWVSYLVGQGHAAEDSMAQQNAFMVQYGLEQLDIDEYLRFHLTILSARSLDAWDTIRTRFLQDVILPRLSPDALSVLEAHRKDGHRMAIVTATHSFLSGAIGDAIGMEVIAPVVEIVDGQVTGRVLGAPAFREKKIARVEAWLGCSLGSAIATQCYFYSDSVNDLPLLEAVSDPVAVNPDDRLARVASQRGWPQLSWTAAGG
jgi:HAD superfamily hydrolase (TIGR01490 family)